MSALHKFRTLYKVSAVLCGILMMSRGCVPYVKAAGTAEDPVRIAIPVSSIGEEDSTISGYMDYTQEYLNAITQYTDWTYEMITVPGDYESGLEEAFSMLREGKADIIAPLSYSEDAGEGICFSQGSYATATVTLQIPNQVFEGFDFGTEVRVAVRDESSMKRSADEYFKKNRIEPQYIVCGSAEEQIQAVCGGEADVMLNSNLEYIPNMTVVAEFSPQQLYFASGSRQLIEELDDVLNYVNQADPMFVSRLYEKHFIDSGQDMTLEEKEFIRRSEPYVVAVLEGQAPYQYKDDETGEFKGISVELLQRISETTGLRFEFVSVPSWDAILELIQDGEVQMIAGMPCDVDFALERNLTISRSFASASYMLISRSAFPGVGEDQRLALSATSTYTEGDFAGQVIWYPNMEECIEAVRTGKADYTYADLYAAQYFMRDVSHSSLKMVSQAYAPRSVCFGLAKPTDHELLGILNKAISQMSDEDIQGIISHSVNQTHTITLVDLIYCYPVESVVILGIAGLTVIGLLMFLFWKKVRLNRRLRRRAMEDGLTNLYNSAACRELVSEKLKNMREGQTGAFLIMDIDDFKGVNDRYGHQTGDQILTRFADLLKSLLREDSILARIGGDEFVVFLDYVRSEENIAGICSRIQEGVRSIDIGAESITISIGTVSACRNDDYDTLYRLADAQLYEAKRSQKGQFRQAIIEAHCFMPIENRSKIKEIKRKLGKIVEKR